MRKLLIISIIILSYVSISNTYTYFSKDHIIKQIKLDRHWNKLINAIIQVESKDDSLIVGSGNAVGVLQITPVYVKQVNKICGTNYTLKDRFSKVKSIEIFNLMNAKYNTEKDFYKAVRLHNPTAKRSYYNKVLKQYQKIKHTKSIN